MCCVKHSRFPKMSHRVTGNEKIQRIELICSKTNLHRRKTKNEPDACMYFSFDVSRALILFAALELQVPKVPSRIVVGVNAANSEKALRKYMYLA